MGGFLFLDVFFDDNGRHMTCRADMVGTRPQGRQSGPQIFNLSEYARGVAF